MDEAEVVKNVARELGALGYRNPVQRRGRGRGPDLHLSDYAGHQFVVEAKGERGGKFRDSAMDTDICIALGQLIIRYSGGHSSGKSYGVAFPSSFKRRLFGKLKPQSIDLLRLHCFFVSPSGRVEHLDSRALKRGLKEGL